MTSGNTNPIIGPDLNASRSLLDEKLYRQILLPNGLRAVLISDVPALKKISKKSTLVDTKSENSDVDDLVEVEHCGDNLIEVSDDDNDSDVSGNACNNSSECQIESDDDIDDDDEMSVMSDDDDDDDDESDGNEEGGERRAAGAILVGAGSYHDPPNVAGLAHFLGKFKCVLVLLDTKR